MLSELLEEHLNNYRVFTSLNLLIKTVKNFVGENQIISVINSEIENAELSRSLFETLIKSHMMDIKTIYECDGDNYEATIKDAKCELCGKEIRDHEYDEVYFPNFKEKLIKYNTDLMKEYFDSDSRLVMENIKHNLHRVVPFVGSGISKSLGLPLWLEMFKHAREQIPDELKKAFDLYYDKGDIDGIITCILNMAPMINTKKDLKMNLIKPVITATKVENEELKKSVLSKLLDKNWEYIITTNYDLLLEQANQVIGGNFNKSLTLRTFEGFEELEDMEYIFHIHGDLNSMDSMIVDKEDYEEMYGSAANMKVLSGLVNKHSLLFLGFSLNDKYFSEEFGGICESNKDYCTNYYVMINGDARDKMEVLNSSNVKFINIIAKDSSEDGEFDVSRQYVFFLEYIDGNIVL